MKPRVTVVSHACVLASNRSPYVTLSHVADVDLVVPDVWRHALAPDLFAASSAPFPGRVHAISAWGVGRPQRYLLKMSPGRFLRSSGSAFVIIEEESFSFSGLWWSWAARRHSLPYAIQVAENLERTFPAPVRRWRRSVLAHASLVMARSPQAAERARAWGARGDVEVVAHGVDKVAASIAPGGTKRVGFVGRLVPEKGIDDLLTVATNYPDLQIEFVGDGPMRERVVAAGDNVRWNGTLSGEALEQFYRSLDVLAVPSRTTATWSEQFGRVIVEAHAAGVPVVAYDSGEIPWVASVTGTVLIAEGDIDALGEALLRCTQDANYRRERATVGLEAVREQFTNAKTGQQLAAWLDRVSRGERPRSRR